MSAPVTIHIIWDETPIMITYHSRRFHDDFDHIELRVEDGIILPVTETGYRSHFLPGNIVEEYGGAEAFVRAWLDDAAKDPEWRKRKEAAKQLSLF